MDKPELGFSYPSDALDPDWEEYDRVHNWRNYISPKLKEMWWSFTDEQKAAIAASADDAAGMEEWD